MNCCEERIYVTTHCGQQLITSNPRNYPYTKREMIYGRAEFYNL